MMRRRYGLMAGMFLLILALAACAAPVDAVETPVAPADEVESAAVVSEDAALPATAYTPVKEESAPVEASTTVAHFRLEPEINGDLVAISIADAEGAGHVHFNVPGPDTELNYLGYMLNGTFFARAAVCPACGSEGLSFSSDVLVCGSCDGEFDLETGKGVGDTEAFFPEGGISYVVSKDVLTMSLSDLVEAYERAAAGEDTLFAPEVELVLEEDEDDDVPACCRR